MLYLRNKVKKSAISHPSKNRQINAGSLYVIGAPWAHALMNPRLALRTPQSISNCMYRYSELSISPSNSSQSGLQSPKRAKNIFFWRRFESSREAVAAWNLANRWRKRGIAMLPVKFGIAFTSK
jgi:hypothetical protein